jgi:hypothetical protein
VTDSPEPRRRGRPAKQPLSDPGPELAALLRYLGWDLAKNADIAAVHRKIESERARTGDRRLSTYGKPQTFREHWRAAHESNILPDWDWLIQPWAIAYGGEDGLREADRLFRLIGAVAARTEPGGAGSDGAVVAGNEALDGYLAQISTTLGTVARSGDPLFAAAVAPQIREFARRIRPWRDGVVDVTDSNYEWLLTQVYGRASQVEATCLPEFLLRWDQPFGMQLAAAHARSGARMTRLFIFATVADGLEERAQRVMFAQVLAGATVHVFSRADSPSVSPPPTRLWDFAIVDNGAVVFPTYFGGAGDIGASVFFGNADAAADYRELFDRLMLHSTEYGRFMDVHAAGKDLPGSLKDLVALLSAYAKPASASSVLAIAQELDQSGEDVPRLADTLRQIVALCANDLPDSLLERADGNLSAAPAYAYLRRQAQLMAQADLDKLDY